MSAIERIPRSTRRRLVDFAVRKTMPYGIEKEKRDVLEKTEQYLDEGYGLVVAVPHFSYGDMPRVIGALTKESSVFRNRRWFAPVARHQHDTPKVKTYAKALDLEIQPITTRTTARIEKERESAGEKILWKSSERRRDSLTYAQKVTEVLGEGGILFVAPQATRQATLKPFNGSPIELVSKFTQKGGVDKLAYLFVGLEVAGVQSYSQTEWGGFNAFKKYQVTLGNVLTREELVREAAVHQQTMDERAYTIMLGLAPEAYKPNTSV